MQYIFKSIGDILNLIILPSMLYFNGKSLISVIILNVFIYTVLLQNKYQ